MLPRTAPHRSHPALQPRRPRRNRPARHRPRRRCSVVAHAVCAARRRRLPGYHAAPALSSAGSATLAGPSATVAQRSWSGSAGAPTHPSCARPPCPGGATASCATNAA